MALEAPAPAEATGTALAEESVLKASGVPTPTLEVEAEESGPASDTLAMDTAEPQAELFSAPADTAAPPEDVLAAQAPRTIDSLLVIEIVLAGLTVGLGAAAVLLRRRSM
jgi:hypothetical protein